MAAAGLAVGQLEAMLAGMARGPRRGALRRLALIEVEAMLWAQGMPLRREEIGRDLLDARAGSDLEAMRQARWAMRRLDGQGALADLRGFLGLHRVEDAGWSRVGDAAGSRGEDAPGSRGGEACAPSGGDILGARPVGEEFDAAAAGFLAALERFGPLHDFALAPVARMLWRLSDLSPADLLIEAAIWSGRRMAAPCEALRFLPLGRHGRAVWGSGGPPAAQMEMHLRAVHDGAVEARLHLAGITDWAAQATRAMAPIRSGNPAKVIAVLAAQPLVSAAMVEEAAGISRMTADRLLARMQEMGLIREVTGSRRFRLWMAMG